MNITMQNIERLTLEQIREFVEGSRAIGFSAPKREAVYEFIERVLKSQQYRRLGRGQKGIVRRFLVKMTGLSRAQLTRWIGRWMKTRRVQRKPVCRPSFPRKYTAADIALLAGADASHEDLSGPAIRRVMQREHEVFGKVEYVRLADISVSHIYNLRNSTVYRSQRVRVHHTQARQVSIAERRKPDPRGRAGYLRVDTVHQGNHDGQAGLYHINAVDTVTQWQVVGCVETISERHLIPVLMAMLHQFPFLILGFHCDNGSEFINHIVAQLLEKLLIEFTKSRAYRTTDNALVEGKNGAVIRKHIGYGAIPAEQAEDFQKFYTAHLNPYLNYHRPCGFATIRVLPRGKRQRRYPVEDYRTPYEKLVSLPKWEQYLKPGISVLLLQQQAMRRSDTEAAQEMQRAKLALLAKSRRPK
jgi:transposase InsO family protein